MKNLKKLLSILMVMSLILSFSATAFATGTITVANPGTYNYVAYKQCIDDLLDANGIFIPFRRRKLDHYLWHLYRKTE